jgi:HAD superfamily hydrolase (TIGR01490 family)
MTTAAFFDMDNTLLTVDTGMSYSRFLYRRGELGTRMLAKTLYWATLYKLAVLDIESVVTRLVADLEGDSEADMIAKCDVWYREDIAPFVAPAARVAIARHREMGHAIVLATGSTVYAARPVARGIGIEHVLATELEVNGDTFTGKPRTLCFGEYKVKLAEQWAIAHGIDLTRSYFYSDSFNDLPLLERVGNAVAINPDTRLSRLAKQRGWPMMRWS